MPKLRIQGRFGYATNRDMKELLGLEPTDKLPIEGMAARLIQGIKVWVNPHKARPDGHKTSTHRIMVECPYCAQVLSAGRMHQHKCPPSIVAQEPEVSDKHYGDPDWDQQDEAGLMDDEERYVRYGASPF